jgi:hypothetical protein
MTPPDTNLRPVLARHLQQRLEAFLEGFRQNLALLGPLGSGKTFQLQRLIAPPQPAVLLIYCPVYRESCHSFIQRLLAAALTAGLREPPGVGPDPVRSPTQRLSDLLARAEPQLPLAVTAARQVEEMLARRLYGEAFIRALDTIPLLIQDCGAPCVLLLDEFLLLQELGLVHAFHELGKRVMIWPSTLFVLASSSVYRARIILRERLQLLFGQFELLTLDALAPEPAAAWLTEELGHLSGVAMMGPFLIQWLGAYPRYLTVFLRRLRELAALSRTRHLTEPLFLHTAWDLLGHAEGALHQWCAARVDGLSRGRLGARALEALIHIAEGARTATDLGQRIGRARLSDALQLLVEQDLAQRNGSCWMVTDPILRCWLSTVLLAQRASAPLDRAETQRRFEAHLRGIWTRWVEAQQLSFPEQVVALFGKFADDTLSLDSKTGRLPRFETITTHEPNGSGSAAYLIAEAHGRRWCVTVQADSVDERAVANFDAFCRRQLPKPSRKVLVVKAGMEDTARLLAKATNMWVWNLEDLRVLTELYRATLV